MLQFLKRLFKPAYVYHVVYGYKNGRGTIIQLRNTLIKTDEDMMGARESISKSVGEKIIIENLMRLRPTQKNYDDIWNNVEVPNDDANLCRPSPGNGYPAKTKEAGA